MAGLWLLLHKTSFGRVVRAGVQRPDMVAVLGIRLQPYMTAIVVLGVASAALGGALFGPITIVHPAMGTEIMTVAFVVVVIGGLGSFWGVVLAALLVGVVRGITIHFVPAAGEASMYVLMFLVLMFRPRGLLGERIERFEMSTRSRSQAKHRPLWIGAPALVLLPFALRAIGLTLDNATVVVILAMAAMGLNLLVGLHRAGVVRPQRLVRHRRLCRGARAAALVQGPDRCCRCCFSVVFTAALSLRRRLPDPAPARRVLLAADAGAVRADLRHRLPLDRAHRRRGRPRRHGARHARPVRPRRPPRLLRPRRR